MAELFAPIISVVLELCVPFDFLLNVGVLTVDSIE